MLSIFVHLSYPDIGIKNDNVTNYPRPGEGQTQLGGGTTGGGTTGGGQLCDHFQAGVLGTTPGQG